MLAAAVFELEGVLLDSRAARRDALAGALAADGVSLDLTTFERWGAGRPADQAAAHVVAALAAAGDPAARALDETAVALAALRAERAFEAHVAAGPVLVAGAVEALHALAARLRLALVTRARRRIAELVLPAAGLDAIFSCVVAEEDVRQARPAPDGHHRALDRLARRVGRPLDPRAVVAFDDTLVGVAAARAAGLRAVLVSPDDDATPSDAADADAADADAADADAADADAADADAADADAADAADADAAVPEARLRTVAGLTPRALAHLLDLPFAPAPAPPPASPPSPRRAP